MAPGDGDLADGGGRHIVDRDLEEAFGNLFEALGAMIGDFLQPRARCDGIDRLVRVRTKHCGKCTGLIRPRNRLQSVTVSGPPER